MRMVPLGDLMASRVPSLDPSKYPKEVFELWSIPAFDTGQPEITEGANIGSSKKCVEPNDVLLSRIVPHIRRAWVVSKSQNEMRQLASSEWIVFRDESFYPDYLRHALTSDSFHSRFMQTVAGVGGSLLRARPDGVKKIKIPLPPLEEQRRIAAILDKADGVRRKRKEAIRLTEELLKSTFLEMFGDPVTNPKGWEIAKLGDFGKILTGNTPPRSVSENYGDEIEWIKSDNITTPEHFLTEAEEKLSAKGKKIARTVPNGSVLVTCIAGSRSSIGRAALTDREVAFNQQINAVVPNSDVDPYFLYGQLFVAQHLVQAQSTDSMKGMVNKSKFSSIEFIKPPSQKQQKFGKWFLGFHRYYMNLISGEEQSENLFNSLLQRAFRGEL
ncbi:MAG: restriction endonuclease subunit S [Microcystis aeruginosa Ma_SC_T_19800800_S464]|uniref:Restriction endonuclease subunit S n=1 Tax=Microcystis aeruginosa Ma_SC_T_19800800_S464 TaxID=2486257 RepID=A0A552E2J4_MICAE|nr:MAG: restriction endonuclease subunit S [Microcystis aeruginosa Ma_SC_T_19800800_S464]